MRWDPDHHGSDLIDRRGEGPGSGGGLLFTLIMLMVRSRWGWAGVIVVLLGYVGLQLLGGVSQRLGGVNGDGAQGTDEQAAFVGFVLDDIQDSWSRRRLYQRAELVLFTQSTRTACGYGDAATGPFYCPADRRVYIDLSFYDELRRRLGAGGDFAQAYVIAHEIGHHLQKLDGTSDAVDRAPRSRQRGASGLSARRERALGPPRAPGRLLRWRLDPRRRGPRPARARRHRRGADRRIGDRRRPPAADVARDRVARELHARDLGPARAVVSPRLRQRRSRRLRQLLVSTLTSFEVRAFPARAGVLRWRRACPDPRFGSPSSGSRPR